MSEIQMPTYNKLVRDKILEIIEANGTSYHSRILEKEELLREIKEKMVEEANEFKRTDNVKEAVEELADILELVLAALHTMNVTYEQLETVRAEKKEKRGGFEKGIYLINVEDK